MERTQGRKENLSRWILMQICPEFFLGETTMKCPYCGDEESKVIDSRPTEDSERIRRRRECLNCHMRFTTYEVVETVPLIVIKKDNSR